MDEWLEDEVEEVEEIELEVEETGGFVVGVVFGVVGGDTELISVR